jgi:hypothetical protein|tara:strand:- start:144 stop:2336 length:2193 start_codon:yes stop_codon:yes gene_type:complete
MSEQENSMYQNADELYFNPVEGESGLEMNLEGEIKSRFVGLVEDRFAKAEEARGHDEGRWLRAYHNFRGLYGKNVKFRESEKSKVFIKITKTKVLAAFGQLVDVIFGTGQFPIGVKETRIPEGIATYQHLDMTPGLETSQAQSYDEETEEEEVIDPFDVGYEGDGKTLKPGATFSSGETAFENAVEKGIEEGKINVVDGPSPNPQTLEMSPAKEAARQMQKLIHDQIEESNGSSELRNAIFEAALFGTGIVKGPFNHNKIIGRWNKNEETGEREYSPLTIRVPRIEFVSIWDFFPDPSATTIDECEYTFHRHKLNRSQLRALSKLPYFDKEAIRECLVMGPNYEEKDYEQALKDDTRSDEYGAAQFEVLEYWGIMDAEYAREVGMELSEDVDDLDELQVNAWISNGKLLRTVINPFTPYRLPYNAFSYERNPYSFFGIGVAENMDDSQQIMNGHARMAIDNLALSGSVVFDVDESALVGGQSMDIYPGKVFRRQAGMPGQAIHGVKFPNTTQENMMMFDKFRQLADEQTGIPSYSHGQTGVQSMTRTASGMSMLLGAASLNIKTVVKNLDDFLLKPLGQAYYQWNMQFFDGELDIEGDLEIRAMGTNSLMQKEVRSQRLTMFLQTAQNPAIAPFVKISKIISELAYSLDLDPDEILNDPEEAAIMAQIIGAQNAGQATGSEAVPASNQPGSVEGVQGAPQQPQELGATGTGGGNIGTGNVPQPGESEFSG